MSWSMPEISTLYGGAVLSDYRSLTRYAADLTEGMRNHFSLGLSYKDIFNMLFLNLSAGYSLTKPDILYGYDFDGIYSTTLTTRTGELSHTVSAGIELSKGFYWKDLTAKLEGLMDGLTLPAAGAGGEDEHAGLLRRAGHLPVPVQVPRPDIQRQRDVLPLPAGLGREPHPAADRLQRPHPQRTSPRC